MIDDPFRATVAYVAAQDLPDLFKVSLHGDDIQDFDTRWNQALSAANEIPTENVLVGVYKCKKKILLSFRPNWLWTTKRLFEI